MRLFTTIVTTLLLFSQQIVSGQTKELVLSNYTSSHLVYVELGQKIGYATKLNDTINKGVINAITDSSIVVNNKNILFSDVSVFEVYNSIGKKLKIAGGILLVALVATFIAGFHNPELSTLAHINIYLGVMGIELLSGVTCLTVGALTKRSKRYTIGKEWKIKSAAKRQLDYY